METARGIKLRMKGGISEWTLIRFFCYGENPLVVVKDRAGRKDLLPMECFELV